MENTMKYYKNNNNQIFAYDDEQIEQGYGANLIAITEVEKCEILAPTVVEIRKEEINTQITEAKAYLSSTDFYMTVDKYTELDEARKVELTTKRAEARELINTLEADIITLQGAI